MATRTSGWGEKRPLASVRSQKSTGRREEGKRESGKL